MPFAGIHQDKLGRSALPMIASMIQRCNKKCFAIRRLENKALKVSRYFQTCREGHDMLALYVQSKSDPLMRCFMTNMP